MVKGSYSLFACYMVIWDELTCFGVEKEGDPVQAIFVFFSISVLTYVLASIPVMFGWGVTIDFGEDATFGQKAAALIKEGLQSDPAVKLILSAIIAGGWLAWRRRGK